VAGPGGPWRSIGEWVITTPAPGIARNQLCLIRPPKKPFDRMVQWNRPSPGKKAEAWKRPNLNSACSRTKFTGESVTRLG